MDIRIVHSETDQFCIDTTTVFCIDGKCHVHLSVGAKFQDNIPEGANALKYIDGNCSRWKVVPCDGKCHPTNPLPQCIMDDVLAFLKDGEQKDGYADDAVWHDGAGRHGA